MSSEERLQSANFNRPPRIQLPLLPHEAVDIPAPPHLPRTPELNWLVSVIPVMGIGVMAIFFILRSRTDTNSGISFALPLLFLALFTISGTLLAQRWRRKEREKSRQESEADYIRLLEEKRTRLQAAHNAQIGILESNFPQPQDNLHLALSRDNRLWERRPQDKDFAAFRLGIGSVPSSIAINLSAHEQHDALADRAFALADTYRFLDNAPVVTSLQEHCSVGICGKRQLVLKTIRAIICHLAVTHAPQDLHIHLIAPQAHHHDWRWLEWLPHTSQSHQGGAADLMALDLENIRNLLGSLSQVVDERREHDSAPRIPHLLVIFDGPQLAENEAVYSTILRDGHQVGASAICLVGNFESVPSDCKAVLAIEGGDRFRFALTGTEGVEVVGAATDALSLQDAEHIARALAAVNMREVGAGGRIPRRVDFLDLYGVRRAEGLYNTIDVRWTRPIVNGILPHPIPIGRESLAATTEILLDEDHHGPHGVIAGTTGSGKSELMQTMVCAMALEHDPRLLNFLLIDFKGGSTFNVFADLPHTVGMVTNLDGMLVERVLQALKAETEYRQQFFKDMNVRDITQYHRFYSPTRAHIEDASYQPLPHLFIIVDEFAQLAKEMPDFMRELVRTVQVGRSLGLHLILGTQSPMDVITDEMNANLQFRICLRVQNIEASRSMLRRPDAAYLPAGWPGRGYFQVGERGLFKQFQAAYVGGDYQPGQSEHDSTDEELVLELITDTGQAINLLPRASFGVDRADMSLAGEPYTTAHAIGQTIIEYTRNQQIPWMPPILLPPLEERITLAVPFDRAIIGGWNGQEWLSPGRDHTGRFIKLGSAPVGLLDDVYERTQNPLWIHLNAGTQERTNRKDGHAIILGGPGTGKTMFLRTLAISQALLHPPDQLHMYFLSFTGSGLDELGNLPHADRVVHGIETERVRRLFARLIHTLDERQAEQGDLNQPTILLCMDQYEQFRDSYYDQHVQDFERLINEGRAVGIYVVMVASSITAIPDRLRALVQQRIALQLNGVTDYLLAVGHINTQIERVLPNGRGYYHHNPPLACQISLPCTETTVTQVDDALDAMADLIQQMRGGYLAMQGIREADALPEQGQSPAPIRELPTRIPLDTLPLPQVSNPGHIVTPLGRYDDDWQQVFSLDWQESGPHFVISGPPVSGKSNMLLAAILSAAQQYSPRNLRFLLVDFTGHRLRVLDDLKHVIGRVTDGMELQAQLANLQGEFTAYTQDGHNGDLSASIPITVLVIDDYDVVSEALSFGSDVLLQLRDLVRLHSERGLHIWLAGYLERIGDPLIKQLLLRRSGFGLRVRESLQNLNIRVSDLSAEMMPEGRAYFARHHTVQVIQTALVEDTQAYVHYINTRIWPDCDRARWGMTAKNGAAASQRASVESDARDDLTFDLDIDTDGLIQDLLGGLTDE